MLFPACPRAPLNKPTTIFVCRDCGSTSVGGFGAEAGGLTFPERSRVGEGVYRVPRGDTFTK